MAVVIFFGSIVNLFFHLGLIQYLILKVSFVINFIMGTSPTESINSTANVFLGQVWVLIYIFYFQICLYCLLLDRGTSFNQTFFANDDKGII